MSKTKPSPSSEEESAFQQHTDEQSVSATDEKAIPALARLAVETFVLESRVAEPPLSTPSLLLERQSACFVTLKTLEGELRGCIGTIEPEKNMLAEEIIANGINAATRDPRFPPVSPAELPFLRYSVDVLDPPEPTNFDDLDPTLFGVIVVDSFGMRRGLLLPAIEGVKTASQQVQIAARKAGIVLQEPHMLYRFRVRRFREA
jgi:AmmeMemoRadiSam system protein A